MDKKKIYLAGKMGVAGGYRNCLIDSIPEKGFVVSSTEMCNGKFACVGPQFWLDENHGTFIDEHGSSKGWYDVQEGERTIKDRCEVVTNCFDGIDKCDVFFCYFDFYEMLEGINRHEEETRAFGKINFEVKVSVEGNSDIFDAYGTLVEIGYAKAKNKPIIIAYFGEEEDMIPWFACITADSVFNLNTVFPYAKSKKGNERVKNFGKEQFLYIADKSKYLAYCKYPDYHSYIASEEWKVIRQKAIEYYGSSCVLCGNKNGLNVHHRRYPDELGTESIEDLIVLCGSCHSSYHKNKRVRT